MEQACPVPVRSGTGIEILLTTTISDSHTWNLIFLQLMLEELGHTVKNLGACVPDQTVLSECMNIRPGLVVISSVNGHGYNDGIRLVRLLRDQPQLADTPIIIGGKLGITGGDASAQSERLLAAGFSAVFADGASLDSFQDFVLSLSPPETVDRRLISAESVEVVR